MLCTLSSSNTRIKVLFLTLIVITYIFKHKNHQLHPKNNPKSCFIGHKAALNGTKRLTLKNYFKTHSF